MKHDRPRFDLTAALLSAATISCGVGCVITGFDFDILAFFPVTAAFLMFGLLCSLFAASKKTWHILIPGLFVFVLLWLNARDLLLSLEALLYRITKMYDGGYGWGYIRWSEESLTDVSVVPALITLGCLLMLPVYWTLHCRMWIGLALIPAILPLGVCCVVTDSIPSVFFVAPLIACLLLLVLPHLSMQQKHPPRRLTAMLMIPVILFSLLLSISCYGDGKTEQAQTLQDRFLELLGLNASDILPNQGPVSVPDTPHPEISLDELGPRNPSRARAMTVLTEYYEGIVYLRGRSYDTYTGTGWHSMQDTTGENGWPISGSTTKDTLTVSVLFSSDLQFFPYYIMDSGWTDNLVAGGYENKYINRNYAYDWSIPIAGSECPFKPLSSDETAAYLALPEATQQAAEELLSSILTDSQTTSEKVYAIQTYVEHSAAYDQNTPAMGEDADDFVLWFLEERDTGYCVHFASAATVLLRAAGIPARYVSGYIAYAVPGQRTTVTDEQSHAWVEYLDPQRGWTMLEATPGAEALAPIPTETTAPTETTQPSKPTQPSESIQPGETSLPPTVPGNTTKPSVPAQTQPQSPIPGTSFPVTEVLKVLLIIAAVWALLAGQYQLRRNLRYRRHHQGEANQQAIRRWKYVRHLAKLTRQKYPDSLHALTEKAVFSQHQLTRQELAQYDQWIAEAQALLLNRPLPIKWLLKLIFAVK